MIVDQEIVPVSSDKDGNSYNIVQAYEVEALRWFNEKMEFLIEGMGESLTKQMFSDK